MKYKMGKRGQALPEYAFTLGFLALTAILAMVGLGSIIVNMLNTVNGSISGVGS